MSFLGRLALLFVVVPILELVLLIEVGQLFGLLPTLALVLATGISGAYLARAEGIRVLRQFQAEVAAGRVPGQSLQDGIAVLVGGAFLLTPGILTDVVGFALLLPFTRRWIQKRFRMRLEAGIRDGTIRTVVGHQGGVWAAGFRTGGFAAGGSPADPAPRPDRSTHGLDPRHEISIGGEGSASASGGSAAPAGVDDEVGRE